MICKTGSILALLASILLGLTVQSAAFAADPTPNPFLAAEKYAITHFDSAQTDAFPYAVPPGTANVSPLALPQVVAGPINLMTLASTSPNYMWGVSSTGVSYIKVSNNRFTAVARLPLPGAILIAQNLLLQVLNQEFTSIEQIEQALALLSLGGGQDFGISGAYSVVDRDNVLYTNYGNTIYAFTLNVPQLPILGIRLLRSLNASSFLPAGEGLVGLGMTYDGKLVVLGTRSVSIVARDFGSPAQTVSFGSDESISNSMAVDESNGIYVVTDKLLHKVIWTGTQLSQNAVDGAWVSPYDTGDSFPTAFGSGSGSTPTLMGFGSDPDKLVVITDGVKRMKLAAFWRDQIPPGFSSRLAGQIQVNCGLPPQTEFIQSDQSVAVDGYGAFVVNNVAATAGTGNIFVDVIARGPVLESPRGVERFEWNPQADVWQSVWARPDISDNSMVPAISSAADNVVFVSGYYSLSGWEVTGLSWITGQTVHRTVFGPGILGNGSYALIQYLPDGDLLFNSFIGPTRVQLPGGQVFLF